MALPWRPATDPIENRIGQVFVPVTDIGSAIEWYCRLLGVPTGAVPHEGGIYDLPMAGETRLALDATKPQVSNSSQPLFFFWTQEIHEAHRFLEGLGIDIVAGPQDIGSVSFLIFRDPDRNLLMVCQRNMPL